TAARKAEFSQSRVQEIAGVVAGERPPGAVGAAQPRGKAHDQKPRVVGSKGIDRSVKPVRLALAPRLAKRHQPRTARAIAAGHSARAHGVKAHYFREPRCGQNRSPGRRKAKSVSAMRSNRLANPGAIFAATRRDDAFLDGGVVARRS